MDVLIVFSRVLALRVRREDLESLSWRHFILGLTITWIVGMGRYWDNDRAVVLQKLGVGSVVYVFVLAVLLWSVAYPLAKEGWSYFRVVTYISLTAAPGILYAVPVERWMDMVHAQWTNALFLLVVAIWRVAMWYRCLRVLGGLPEFPRIITLLLPLTLIVTVLTVLNLEHVVFHIMAGNPPPPTGKEMSHLVLFVLTGFSVWSFVPLLILYVVCVVRVRRVRAGHGTMMTDSTQSRS